jgi:archaellum component FlaC
MMMPTRVIDPQQQILELLNQMNTRFNTMDERFNTMERRFDARFDKIDERFEKIDERFEKIDARFDKVDLRLNVVDGKIKGVENELGRLRLANMVIEKRLGDVSAQVQSLDGKVDDLTTTVALIHAVVIPREDGSSRADEARHDLRRQDDQREAAAGVG